MKQKKFAYLQEFLKEYKGMAIVPFENEGTKIVGLFEFTAQAENLPVIRDAFELEIIIPSRFPKDTPFVYETGGRIPREKDYHVYENGWLCLGSYFRLKILLWNHTSLLSYLESCLLPFLYAFSHKERFGGDSVFGGLKHYGPGLVEDYAEILGVSTIDQTRQALYLLSIPHNQAINKNCPCGCGRRLRKCEYRNRLLKLRRVASQDWFLSQLSSKAFK